MKSSAARAAHRRLSADGRPAAPTFVSGQLFQFHHLVRLVWSTADLQCPLFQRLFNPQQPPRVPQHPPRQRPQRPQKQGGPGDATDITGPKQTVGAAARRRCAARAALDFKSAIAPPTCTSTRRRRPCSSCRQAALACMNAGDLQRGAGPAQPGGSGYRIAVRLTGACREFDGVHEIERRPRGASRPRPAPTSVSGQLFQFHHLVRLVWSTADLQCPLFQRLFNPQQPPRVPQHPPRQRPQRPQKQGGPGDATDITGPKQM